MRKLVLLAIVLAACGGGLNPGMSGTWNGTDRLSVGSSVQNFPGQVVVSVAGANAEVREVCLDGSGTITAEGSGYDATWNGTLACPPVVFTNCASVTLTYNQGSLTLYSDGSLTVEGSGQATGCGINEAFSATFHGTK